MEAELLRAVSSAVLLLGLGYAAVEDWRKREVSDRLWVLLAIVGIALGFLLLPQASGLAIGLWGLLGAFALEHLLPWDVPLEKLRPWLPSVVEGAFYAIVGATVVLGAWRFGIGAGGVPFAVIALLASIWFARALFEIGILYGGADAKALIVAATLVPTLDTALLPIPGPASSALGVFPFAVLLLTNAALLAIAVPIALALRNLRHGEFSFPRGFTGYLLPVSELPHKFVWIRDPTFRPEEDSASTEEDEQLRARQARELAERGVREVWVTPQVPFMLPMLAGAVTAVLWGGLVFDLLALFA
jgi:archaeal preflagellin peptidase FlaK